MSNLYNKKYKILLEKTCTEFLTKVEKNILSLDDIKSIYNTYKNFGANLKKLDSKSEDIGASLDILGKVLLAEQQIDLNTISTNRIKLTIINLIDNATQDSNFFENLIASISIIGALCRKYIENLEGEIKDEKI